MEILITEKGWLEIKRGGKAKPQHCPFQTTFFCGDRCPLFGEPSMKDLQGKGTLTLCQQTVIHFDKITDNRTAR